MLEKLKKYLKPEKIEKIPMKLVTVKRNKVEFNCYKGKFISIEIDTEKDNIYFMNYSNNKYTRITNKVSEKDYDSCVDYDYGIVYDYNEEYLTVAIICKNGYIKKYDIELYDNFNNGEAFIIKDNNLINNNKVVGKIKNKINEKVSMNCLEDNKLICFISK